ncbi:MAG: LysM peptidoglycan-binding domain-containing protein [Pseudomonadota bacterium]|nr:LysM peptidoglycan-binding domain-containing protein [Pseudomonadota bacterium]
MMNFKRIIYFLLLIVILLISFSIYKLLFTNNNEILILTSDIPIKESPINAPEMKEPDSISCVYSLWKSDSECINTEELLIEKTKKKGFFTIRYATFDNYKNAEFHIKKLRQIEELNAFKLSIETIENNKIIRIKKGDTLSKIAKIYKVPLRDIILENSIKDPGKINLNQKLIIPLNDKYRIITMNIDNYKKAKKICDLLLDNQFTCLIKSQ